MIRALTVVMLLASSGCAWRGDTKFTATYSQLPPGPSGVQTDRWAVDLDAKQITFDTDAPKTLSDAQVSNLKSALGALAPASKESCMKDGEVLVIELADGQTRYTEQWRACPGSEQGAYFYVESLEKVFTQLRELAQ